jgi:hypothetical protein
MVIPLARLVGYLIDKIDNLAKALEKKFLIEMEINA